MHGNALAQVVEQFEHGLGLFGSPVSGNHERDDQMGGWGRAAPPEMQPHKKADLARLLRLKCDEYALRARRKNSHHQAPSGLSMCGAVLLKRSVIAAGQGDAVLRSKNETSRGSYRVYPIALWFNLSWPFFRPVGAARVDPQESKSAVMLANITYLAHELSAKRRHFCTFSSFRDSSRLLASFGIFSLHFSSFCDFSPVLAVFAAFN